MKRMHRIEPRTWLIVTTLLIFAGCGKTGDTGSSSTVSVSISPATASVCAGCTQAFTTSVTGSTNTGVTWSVQEGATGGNIASDGTFTAPAATGEYHVVATSQADSTKNATATVTVTPAVSISINPSITVLTPGERFSFSATVSNASNAATTWSVQEGAAGGTIDSSGLYTAPANAGDFHVVATSQADPNRSSTASVSVRSVPKISGTITYTGTKTGRIYVAVSFGSGGGGFAGTSIASAGAYTVRGLQWPGQFTVSAFMDTLGRGMAAPAADPAGSTQVTLTFSGGSVSSATGVNITLSDPAPQAVSQVSGVGALAGNETAIVFWNRLTDPQGREIADHYRVYWSTTANPGPATGAQSKDFPAGSNNNPGIITPLTDGSVYHFTVSALNNGTEGPVSTDSGPVTVGARTGGTTVSGTVTFGVAPKGPLFVGVFSQAGGAFFTKITNPTSPQAYTITGVTNGSYQSFAFFDQDNNGSIDATDPSVGMSGPGAMVTVSGSALTAPPLTIPSGNATARVLTQHQKRPSGESYSLVFTVTPGSKLPVKATLLSGPNLSPPVDMASSGWGVQLVSFVGLSPSTIPVVGQSYSVAVSYSDGSAETLSPQVTGLVAGLATPTAPIGAGIPIPPTFTWTAPSPAPSAYVQHLSVDLNNGGRVWEYRGMPSSTASLLYNVDGQGAALVSGSAYNWRVDVEDSNGNSSSNEVSFTAQ